MDKKKNWHYSFLSVKNKYGFFICIFLLLIWLAVMIILSSQDGITTGREGRAVAKFFAKLIYGETVRYKTVSAVHFFLRKAMHCVLYAGFSALFYLLITCFYKISLLYRTVICSAAIIILSFADELHKIPIEGRHFDMFDVSLNLISGFVVLLCALLLTALHRKLHKSIK